MQTLSISAKKKGYRATRATPHLKDCGMDISVITDQLNRIEQMLITLVAALAAEEEPEIPETDLDGNEAGGERNVNDPL